MVRRFLVGGGRLWVGGEGVVGCWLGGFWLEVVGLSHCVNKREVWVGNAKGLLLHRGNDIVTV